MDKDATWYEGKSRLRRRCVRWGRSSPLKGAQFPVHVCCDQTAGWMKTPLATAEVFFATSSTSMSRLVTIRVAFDVKRRSPTLFPEVVFGRPFVKRFALCNRSAVCLSVCPVLSVTLVYCGQTVVWTKMPRGMEVGLVPGDFVLDRNPAPSPQKWGAVTPQFSAHVYCG